MEFHSLIYRFSYDKLSQFRNDEFLMALLTDYIKNDFKERLERSPIMK